MMHAMVTEHVNLETFTVEQIDRTSFMKSQRPTNQWIIWLGEYDNSSDAQCPTFIRNAYVPSIGYVIEPVRNSRNTPLIGAGISRFYLQSIYSHDAPFRSSKTRALDECAAINGLVRVWPVLDDSPKASTISTILRFLDQLGNPSKPSSDNVMNQAARPLVSVGQMPSLCNMLHRIVASSDLTGRQAVDDELKSPRSNTYQLRTSKPALAKILQK